MIEETAQMATTMNADLTKLLCTALVVGFLAGLILGVAGCATTTKHTDARPTPAGSPSMEPSSISTADQQGAANVATGAITGLSYQSVLPIGMVVLLTILTMKDAAILLFVVVLSHRREILRLKRSDK